MEDSLQVNPLVMVGIIVLCLYAFYGMVRKAIERGNETYIKENKDHPRFRQPTEADTKGATNFWFGLFITIVIVMIVIGLKGQ